MTQVTNIDADEAFLRPHLRIIDPNQMNTAILKYKPLDEEQEEEEGITASVILKFVNDFQLNELYTADIHLQQLDLCFSLYLGYKEYNQRQNFCLDALIRT